VIIKCILEFYDCHGGNYFDVEFLQFLAFLEYRRDCWNNFEESICFKLEILQVWGIHSLVCIKKDISLRGIVTISKNIFKTIGKPSIMKVMLYLRE